MVLTLCTAWLTRGGTGRQTSVGSQPAVAGDGWGDSVPNLALLPASPVALIVWEAQILVFYAVQLQHGQVCVVAQPVELALEQAVERAHVHRPPRPPPPLLDAIDVLRPLFKPSY